MKLSVKVISVSLLAAFALAFTQSVLYAQGTEHPVEVRSGGILFPKPFAIAIDDLGWMDGSSLGDDGGPWRTGLRRDFDVRDYKAVVDIAKATGVRLQAAFILSELDRLNIIGQYPHMTWQQGKWDNTRNIGQNQIEIMDFVKENAAWLEFGLHGVGHEFWDENGKRTRAEFYNTDENSPRPEHLMNKNLDVFEQIMAQYGLTRENGHSFPESFVPPAYGYYWNPDGDYSTGSILAKRGLKYVNTQFNYVSELNPPADGSGGFDNGVLVLDRHNYGNPWYELASLPRSPIGTYQTEIIETHWSNLLAADDFLQESLNNEWAEFYRSVQEHPDYYLAKNTEQFYSQWLYRRHVTVTEEHAGRVQIDARSMPAEAYQRADMLGNMVLALKLPEGTHISKALINGNPVPGFFSDAGYQFIYLPKLERRRYTLEYETGPAPAIERVEINGTYNVYGVIQNRNRLQVDLQMYGTQDVHIYTPREPSSVVSDNERLRVIETAYDAGKDLLTIKIHGHDIQGERGVLTIGY
ncbi:MAG: hypothetical protein ACNA8K_05230 [Cyclonatronaceae bacterium]